MSSAEFSKSCCVSTMETMPLASGGSVVWSFPNKPAQRPKGPKDLSLRFGKDIKTLETLEVMRPYAMFSKCFQPSWRLCNSLSSMPKSVQTWLLVPWLVPLPPGQMQHVGVLHLFASACCNKCDVHMAKCSLIKLTITMCTFCIPASCSAASACSRNINSLW